MGGGTCTIENYFESFKWRSFKIELDYLPVYLWAIVYLFLAVGCHQDTRGEEEGKGQRILPEEKAAPGECENVVHLNINDKTVF